VIAMMMMMMAMLVGVFDYVCTFGAGVDSALCIRAQVAALVVFQVARLITEGKLRGEYGFGATIVVKKECCYMLNISTCAQIHTYTQSHTRHTGMSSYHLLLDHNFPRRIRRHQSPCGVNV
jgi:hypothetical protein